MAGTRYSIVLPHKVSGRADKRLLNRARSCTFCGKPLGSGRRLFRAYTGFMTYDLVAAHPACAEAENRRIDTERQEELRRMTPAHQLLALDLLAAVMRAEDETLLHGRPA